MKKSISIFFCLVLLLGVMTGCGRSAENDVGSGDTDTNRPGVNDNVDTGNDGVIGDKDGNNGGNSNGNNGGNNGDNNEPTVTDHPITDDVENGIENAGDAVRRGMDNVGDAVGNAANRMTGR